MDGRADGRKDGRAGGRTDGRSKMTKHCTVILHKSRANNYNLHFKIYVQVYINILNKRIIQLKCITKSQERD